MSIHNEVVKFIAEIELDAQDRENFLQGLKECDKECSDLRDGIDNLDTGIVDIKCKIADLIAYSLVDHLQ